MSAQEIKKEYDALLQSGDLKEMFPTMSGDWNKDKSEFTNLYSLNEDLFGNEELDLEDEDFYDYE